MIRHRLTEPAFRAECFLCIEERDGVGQAAGARVGLSPSVAPFDLIICDGVGQQIRLRLRERLAACATNGRSFVLVGKVGLIERQNRTAAGIRYPSHNRTLGLAIRAPDNGQSLSAMFCAFPPPTRHFGKEQSGTDLGKGDALDGSRRDPPSDYTAMGSFAGKPVARPSSGQDGISSAALPKIE